MGSDQWRAVVGYEGRYEVSDQGGVRSVARRDRRGHKWPAEILSPWTNRKGYLCVRLRNAAGRRRGYLVHRLVLEAFVGAAPDGMEGAHNNGNPGDARLTNLRWATRSENLLDKRRHGTAGLLFGEKNAGAKLSRDSVLRIFALRSRGLTHRTIAKEVGIGHGRVSEVLSRKAWGHIAPTPEQIEQMAETMVGEG